MFWPDLGPLKVTSRSLWLGSGKICVVTERRPPWLRHLTLVKFNRNGKRKRGFRCRRTT